ncbi:hypothetical protein D5086_013237 [Populus alba]|uniref:Uncharacterized protein n=1 Tax=Populus alba TaxID=43335 RepID=A0ACC4C617_POPAL
MLLNFVTVSVLAAERIEMEKRVLLGVLKKNNPIKKRFLKKVVGYLESDSCMFAPLISTPHTDFLASNPSSLLLQQDFTVAKLVIHPSELPLSLLKQFSFISVLVYLLWKRLDALQRAFIRMKS